jgi:hypothetical protein
MPSMASVKNSEIFKALKAKDDETYTLKKTQFMTEKTKGITAVSVALVCDKKSCSFT